MWGSIERVFARIDPVIDTRAIRDVIVIRPAQDADLAPLHDLAELDSAAPLTGPVLVAVVDGNVWAAIALDDERVIADPFRPTAGAIGLLRARAAQLRAADGRTTRGGFALRALRRVGARGCDARHDARLTQPPIRPSR